MMRLFYLIDDKLTEPSGVKNFKYSPQ